MEKPDVDAIDGPAQLLPSTKKRPAKPSLDSVGTTIEINDYPRPLRTCGDAPYCNNGHGAIKASF